MPALTERAVREQRALGPLLMAAVLLGLAGLPIAVWLDLRSLSERLLQLQASETGRIIDDMRSFYASDVVGRVLQAHGQVTTASHNYAKVPGAIPIPATLSIELGKRISAHDGAVQLPLRLRPALHGPRAARARRLREAARSTRCAPIRAQPVVEVDGLAARPQRPDRDAGHDGRGLRRLPQHPSRQPQAATGRSATCAASRRSSSPSRSPPTSSPSSTCSAISCSRRVAGLAFILLQRRQSRLIRGMNQRARRGQRLPRRDLDEDRQIPVAADLQEHLQRPEGRRRSTTERKKLTIFFSDIKDFTATTERLQPEDLTALLNEYLTEMSTIALEHGAHRRQVHRRRHPGLLRRSGDQGRRGGRARLPADGGRHAAAASPSSTPSGASAASSSRSGPAWASTPATAMSAISAATTAWTTRSSAPRRTSPRGCRSIAEPGGIVLSYETYALVRDMVARAPAAADPR